MSVDPSFSKAIEELIDNPNLRLNYTSGTWSTKKQNFFMRFFRNLFGCRTSLNHSKLKIYMSGEAKAQYSRECGPLEKKVNELVLQKLINKAPQAQRKVLTLKDGDWKVKTVSKKEFLLKDYQADRVTIKMTDDDYLAVQSMLSTLDDSTKRKLIEKIPKPHTDPQLQVSLRSAEPIAQAVLEEQLKTEIKEMINGFISLESINDETLSLLDHKIQEYERSFPQDADYFNAAKTVYRFFKSGRALKQRLDAIQSEAKLKKPLQGLPDYTLLIRKHSSQKSDDAKKELAQLELEIKELVLIKDYIRLIYEERFGGQRISSLERNFKELEKANRAYCEAIALISPGIAPLDRIRIEGLFQKCVRDIDKASKNEIQAFLETAQELIDKKTKILVEKKKPSGA